MLLKGIEPVMMLSILPKSSTATRINANTRMATIPTLIIFENGKEIKRKVGYQSLDELRKWVNDEE